MELISDYQRTQSFSENWIDEQLYAYGLAGVLFLVAVALVKVVFGMEPMELVACGAFFASREKVIEWMLWGKVRASARPRKRFM